ncbi:glutathionylspermidine synthase family protein [Ferrovibrio sp.]|uniref:glutathionylspermidine synthase family protein n=1 Tax=Ferrovibrio sp. TaxID=1917215 RepID=UPI0026059DA0|nr:glutathionylspermidine synthase family protein [Ferrovibrio sp.]
MERLAVEPRPDWRERAEKIGFAFHTIDGEPYWCEDAAYSFTPGQIDELDDAAQRLEDMCLELVDGIIRRGDYGAFRLTDTAIALIEQSWQRQDKNLYGRFDLAWNGAGAPKLLEYNADTPTALYEASVVQWEWLDSFCNHCDQFNGIHETLIEAWKHFGLWGHRVHFTCVRNHEEDFGTVEYLRDTAIQAGLDTERLYIDEIGWNGKRFVDLAAKPITVLFKLYPWEWLLQEDFAANIQPSGIRMIEPAWKMLLSTKAILPLLWQAFPDHENLLPASFDRADIRGACIAKPFWGREGAGISRLSETGVVLDSVPVQGDPAPDFQIYQQAIEMPCFDGFYPVLGVWVIASRACGLGIREDRSPITRNTSRFVPHLFE